MAGGRGPEYTRPQSCPAVKPVLPGDDGLGLRENQRPVVAREVPIDKGESGGIGLGMGTLQSACLAASNCAETVWGEVCRSQRPPLDKFAQRPPLAAGRLQITDDEQLTFRLKTPWSDGTTHLLLSPLELKKLAALVPPPRLNLMRHQINDREMSVPS